MSETLRDLVVSLSLNSDNFTRNIKSINKQIQEAESAFRLASAGVENFETTTAGLSSKLFSPYSVLFSCSRMLSGSMSARSSRPATSCRSAMPGRTTTRSG